MGNLQLVNIYCALCVSLLYGSLADRTSQKIYDKIQGDLFCFRRLNATHQIGCSSRRSGNVGVVHFVNTTRDLEWVLKEGPHYPYIVALPIPYFTTYNMREMKNSGRVTGVLVLKGNDSSLPEEGFSPDQSCPNNNFGIYTDSRNPNYASCSKQQWNPQNPALGMMYEDWNMPVFLITEDKSIDKITNECYKKFNEPLNGTNPKPWPLCAAELSSRMLAAGNTEICMRRSNMAPNLNPVKLCDPLSDRNIVTTLFPTNKATEISDNSLVVIGARLDSFSQFESLAPGADSAITGLVTLLAVAKTLSNLRENITAASEQKTLSNIGENISVASEQSDPIKNVLFLIFNGEAFDYIGSSRVVFDMMNKSAFPVQENSAIADQPAQLRLRHISHFLELNQLASYDDQGHVWLHTDPVSLEDESVKMKVRELIKIIKMHSTGNMNFSEPPAGTPLPPASFQTFLRSGYKIPGVVLTNHEGTYTNRYYNSMYDTAENVNTAEGNLAEHLANLTATVSQTVVNILTGKNNTVTVDTDVSLLEELLECYLKNASCKLFREITEPGRATMLGVTPLPLYVSVEAGGNSMNAVTAFTRYLLAYLTGEVQVNRIKENCTTTSTNQIFRYDWMTGDGINSTGICVRSTVYYTYASSPAFEFDDWKSTEYSTWTESVWQQSSVRIFLLPSMGQQGLILGIGITILILSFVIIHSINKHASVIFYTRNIAGC